MADPLPRAECEWGGETAGGKSGSQSRSQGRERPHMFLAGRHQGVQDCELTRAAPGPVLPVNAFRG